MWDFKVLKADWTTTIGAWSEDDVKIEYWFSYLVRQYSSIDRKYHTLKHVQFMLNLAYQNRGRINNWLAVYLAIWFHDVVQNQSGQNEKLSAHKCLEVIKDLNLPESAMRATNLILTTINHEPGTCSDAKVLVDLDLAILGSDSSEYAQYARQCRAEYNVPNCVYRLGRARVLKQILKRENIYTTRAFRKSLEKKARRNLRKELDALEKRE